MTKDDWPESFGNTFMSLLEAGSIIFEYIFGLFIILFDLALLIAVPILIVRLPGALYKQWYGKIQPRQRSDEEVVMGTIASGGNE